MNIEEKYELLLNAYAELSKEKVQFQILATELTVENNKLKEEIENKNKESD